MSDWRLTNPEAPRYVARRSPGDLAQLLADVDDVLPSPRHASEASRREHEQLKARLAAVVAAAPVRLVLSSAVLGLGSFALRLECGHVAYFFQRREELRCHECAGQPSPTRRPPGRKTDVDALLVRPAVPIAPEPKETYMLTPRKYKDVTVECPGCGHSWFDPYASETFPGSACDTGDCLCVACEAGRCSQHDGRQSAAEWNANLRGE